MDQQFQRLLNSPITKWSKSTNKELFDSLFIVLYHWINSQYELLLLNDKETFRYAFYAFLLKNTLNEGDILYDEYFVLKYSENIIDMYIQMKDITKSYCSYFLHEKGRTADDLLQFIFQNSTLLDPQINDEVEDELNNDMVE